MGLQEEMQDIARGAREASRRLALTNTKEKNKVLATMADLIKAKREDIQSANQKDLAIAGGLGLSSAIVDRLTLNTKRIDSMINGLLTVEKLADPVGYVLKRYSRPNGLVISKVRVPIGVICIIYESRPNVTVDSAALCFKSGNSVILRGGKEAINSNKMLVGILKEALRRHNLPEGCIQLIETQDHAAVPILLKLPQYIDLVIPRGGEALIKTVVEQSRIPVIKHYKGICHVYVDKDADLSMAFRIVINAKTQRPGVCNAMETLLVHKDIASRFLPKVAKELMNRYKVELRGCEVSQKLVAGILPAKEEDWHTEYLDLILSIKVVNSPEEAIGHINHYGSMHSDSIVTKNKKTAESFVRGVDSACVFVNTSTRFSDGGEFGMGAEIGISTDKIHARGPMGLEELTSYKYIVRGKGQLRE